jgi:hypothetical protein
MSATGSGNMNSSRAGVAQGIMTRGAADQIGDIASQMRGNAYSEWPQPRRARPRVQHGLHGPSGAGLRQRLRPGLGASQQGQNMTYQNNDALIRAASSTSRTSRARTTPDYQQWQGQDQRASDLLNRYYGIVGGTELGRHRYRLSLPAQSCFKAPRRRGYGARHGHGNA